MYDILETPYSAGFMSQSWWFVEFKQILQLINKRYEEETIKHECIENHLFGAPNEYRTIRMYGYLMKRAKMLSEEDRQLFFISDVETQKLINLTAILRGDRLFYEFFYEVYREKMMLGLPVLEDVDINAFFTRKEQQSEIVEGWSDSTKKHLRSNYLNCLTNAGLLRKGKGRYIVSRILPDDRLVDLLKKEDAPIIKAIVGKK